MADPYMAEIRVFGYVFPPRGWAFCNGQLMTISQNTALFSILGTRFGGDGRVNFALPDMRGRMPMNWGDGRGLSPRDIGEPGGVEGVQLRLAEIPNHPHQWKPSTRPANQPIPAISRSYASSDPNAYAASAVNVTMAPQTVGMSGDNVPHSNLQPSLAINFCIALEGIYPPRQ
jgi:microcystin-dependent protein